ncbi:MAG: hypothetical protein JW938_01215 [Candidatus Omnitrophica bacterium]|nr:hypothetical protein [Candidatus Omnitrophota bacterium]
MSTRKNIIISMIAGTMLFGFSGCAQTSALTRVPPSPVINLIGKSPDDVFRLLNERIEHFTTVQASGDFEIKDLLANTTQKCSCLVLVKAPDDILIKGYQALIPNYFTFIIKGDSFLYYIPRKDIAYRGTIEALKNNKDYTIGLEPHVMHTALIPHLFTRSTHTIEPYSNTLFSVAEMRDEGTIQTIAAKYQFESMSTLPTIIEMLDSNGVRTSLISFNKPTVSGKIAYHKEITIVNDQQQTQISFKFKKLLFNSKLPERLFNVDIPEGVTVEEINN